MCEMGSKSVIFYMAKPKCIEISYNQCWESSLLPLQNCLIANLTLCSTKSNQEKCLCPKHYGAHCIWSSQNGSLYLHSVKINPLMSGFCIIFNNYLSSLFLEGGVSQFHLTCLCAIWNIKYSHNKHPVHICLLISGSLFSYSHLGSILVQWCDCS